MPGQQYRVVEVRSNVDRLSASSVHRLFADMIHRAAHAGEEWLRVVAPKGKTLRLSRAVSTHGPHSEGDLITAAVGIPPIEDAPNRMASVPSPDFFSPVPGGFSSRDYPLFRDRGTGVFGPARAPIHSHTGGMLKFEGADGTTLFRRSVEGQPAGHFMLNTFEEMRRVALPLEIERFKERVQHLYMDPTGGLP